MYRFQKRKEKDHKKVKIEISSIHLQLKKTTYHKSKIQCKYDA